MRVETSSYDISGPRKERYLRIAAMAYEELVTDFKLAKHFQVIDKYSLTDVQNIMLTVPSEEVGLFAASYISQKYLSDNDKLYLTLVEGKVPIVQEKEFIKTYIENPSENNFLKEFEGFGELVSFDDEKEDLPIYQPEEKDIEYVEEDDAWFFSKAEPVIVILDEVNVADLQHIESVNRPLIYLAINPSSHRQERLQQLVFEKNAIHMEIPAPSSYFYSQLLEQILQEEKLTLPEKITTEEIAQRLIHYRGKYFKGNKDFYTLVNQMATSTKRYFTPHLAADDLLPDYLQVETSDQAYEKIQGLIGLHEAKQSVDNLIKRIEFNRQRATRGLASIDNHYAAVFIGNPGTAKTTFAKLLAQVLVDKKILRNPKVKIATKNELIGQYVGHTTEKVQKLFAEYKNGFIFIDEAYSLLEKESRSFSDEALAELVFQMEEHPDTFVVFAGYPDKMKSFIYEANEGLRSRLSNVIHFADYSREELIDIFHYFMKENQIEMADEVYVNKALRQTIGQLNQAEIAEEGNGRLMRNLFQFAIDAIALNDAANFNVLTNENIDSARQAYLQERKILLEKQQKIGF